MRTESIVAAVSNPPSGWTSPRTTTPRRSSRTGAAVSAGGERTNEIALPTGKATGDANTTASAPTLLVVPRTSPTSIGIATLWLGHTIVVIAGPKTA